MHSVLHMVLQSKFFPDASLYMAAEIDTSSSNTTLADTVDTLSSKLVEFLILQGWNVREISCGQKLGSSIVKEALTGGRLKELAKMLKDT